ncbi:MAG: transglutaminase domain-containing protein [Acidimicrobiales bacterium]|nr:transglutaminase domain-containing protein [Acidimicrobiales bacterium]
MSPKLAVSAPRHADRSDAPRWLVVALVASASLAAGIAGRFSVHGQVSADTGLLVGAGLGALAVVGLPSLSLRQTARWVLFVSAAVLVRFGLLGSGATGGGQVLLVYLVAAVAVLVLTGQLAHESVPPVVAEREPERRGPLAALRTIAVISALVVLAALVVAPWVLPRVGSATQPGEGASLRSTDGGGPALRAVDSLDMTTRPELGDEVVFTVEADRASYWRGETFDVWDGRRWTRSDPTFRPLLVGDRLQVGDDDLGARGDDELVQRIRVESSYADVVFATPSAVEVEIDRPVRQRPDGTLVAAPMGRGATYTVTSRRQPLSEARLRAVDAEATPDAVLEQYAQPPVMTDRVRDLAPTLVAGAATRYDAIRAIETWMGDRVEYSLDAPLAPEGVDVVDHFLFDAEQGWCEQIASSLVVLARANGIPARLVTGFVPGDRDPVTGRWLVRAREAHAWAEVWFPEVGWVPFDPTADVPLAGEDGGPQTIAEWLADHLVLLALGAIAVALAAGPLRAAVRRRLAARADRPQGWAAETDARLAALGDRVDRPRRLDETAGAYATALAERWADPRLAAVGHALDDALYAPAPPDAARRAACDEVLDELADAEAPAPDPVGAPSA